MRISKDEYYLKIAETVAVRSTCLKRRYGAVIVSDDRIIATGYNGSPRNEKNCCDVGKCYRENHMEPIDVSAAAHGAQYGTCVAVHAEQNALIAAPGDRLRGASLYLACLDPNIKVTPCNICNRMLKNAGIKEVVTKEGVR